MKSKIVFCIMILMLLAQAGCASQATQRYSLTALIDGEPSASLVVKKAEACYDGSKGYALKFSAKADMGPQAIWHQIRLRLNIEIDDIEKITTGKPVNVGDDSNIRLSANANEHFPWLYSPLTTATGTITITARSENEISGSASLVFTEPDDFSSEVKDSIAYNVIFQNLPVIHYCGTPSPADIQFVFDDTYRVGELMQVKIQNVGQVSYLYNRASAACDLSYFDASGRKFLIPPGTHCDLREYVEIKPSETATLFEWDLSECIEDLFGCVKSQPLPAGTYTIRGAFSSFPDGDSTTMAEATIRIVAE